MNSLEFNLLMSVLMIFALAGSLFVISTLHDGLNTIVITIRLFVAALLGALHLDLLMRFFV